MKLWLLRPVETLLRAPADPDAATDNPWNPWYDKTFGFVVRAETEAAARQFAHTEAGHENYEGKGPWLNERYSTCIELLADGEAGVIIEDSHAA